ncbi:hypothetical protein [uncultured Roseibium sp.]|uniref:hypothetical protein n=1 Tax=uncultured Roseibium sp. TaxID=1936171 RepID=UPI003216D049
MQLRKCKDKEDLAAELLKQSGGDMTMADARKIVKMAGKHIHLFTGQQAGSQTENIKTLSAKVAEMKRILTS